MLTEMENKLKNTKKYIYSVWFMFKAPKIFLKSDALKSARGIRPNATDGRGDK